jgi:hypothetical protein
MEGEMGEETPTTEAPAAIKKGPPKKPSDYGIPAYSWLIGNEPMDTQQWALEMRLQLNRAGAEDTWATGQRPENDREWQLEYSFRQLENRRKSDAQERELRYNVTLNATRQSARGESIRGWVLLAIVFAIILMPIIGMAVGIQAQTFSQFIAPVTGIGGTVLGYWFGQRTSGESFGSALPPATSDVSSNLDFPEQSNRYKS